MIFSFHPEAESEFTEAINYYESKEKDLGIDFALEVYSCIKRILAHPFAWPIIEDDIRRSLVSRFPYGILYTQIGKEIVILAVMHLNRKPDYWKERKG